MKREITALLLAKERWQYALDALRQASTNTNLKKGEKEAMNLFLECQEEAWHEFFNRSVDD